LAFSFIFAAHWFFFYSVAGTAGHQMVIGANNMSTAFDFDQSQRQQVEQVMEKFREYFAKFFHFQFEWTIIWQQTLITSSDL
jgi:hypothetical protein